MANRAPGGPLAMVSPANTWPGLTQKTNVPGEPTKYYPNGTRNYARVVAPDNFQGPALALLAKQLGVKSVFILNDKQAYGAGVAFYFQEAAKKMGIHTAVETNGFYGDRLSDTELDAIDLVLLGIKTWDPARHLALTGKEIGPTLEFARRLAARRFPH